jgi:DNA-binding transcriptional MerR regulator
MSEGYTTFFIENKLGIPIGKLKEWVKAGWIEPHVQKASGRGTKALFSKADLHRIGRFKKLIELGLSREAASGYLKQVSDDKLEGDHFMLFRYSDKPVPGGKGTKCLGLQLGAWESVGLKNGAADISDLEPAMRNYIETSGWGHLLIINFDEVHKEIEKAIGK